MKGAQKIVKGTNLVEGGGGRAITTGNYNVANGTNAGRYLSDGTTLQTIAKNSIFIGHDTKGSAADSQTNQIVIRTNATGNGSNTITLGNSAVTGLFCQVTAIT